MAMEGPSRASWAHALATVHHIQQDDYVDLRALAGELFALAEALTAQPKLCRAFADSSRDARPKRDLAHRLFADRVSHHALEVLESAVGGRWATHQDLIDAVERLGIDTVLAAAQRDGHLDQVQSELFAFERTVAGEPELGAALRGQEGNPTAKAALVVRLLGEKALPDTVWLAQRPVLHSRGRRYSAAIWRQLHIATARRRQVTAHVTSAIPLDAQQRERLADALEVTFGKRLAVQVEVDPDVVGGIHVKVGDEVVDGTVKRRLEDARIAMGISKKEQFSS
jgi:F-type H+-transporting ATPase subunit delta